MNKKYSLLCAYVIMFAGIRVHGMDHEGVSYTRSMSSVDYWPASDDSGDGVLFADDCFIGRSLSEQWSTSTIPSVSDSSAPSTPLSTHSNGSQFSRQPGLYSPSRYGIYYIAIAVFCAVGGGAAESVRRARAKKAAAA